MVVISGKVLTLSYNMVNISLKFFSRTQRKPTARRHGDSTRRILVSKCEACSTIDNPSNAPLFARDIKFTAVWCNKLHIQCIKCSQPNGSSKSQCAEQVYEYLYCSISCVCRSPLCTCIALLFDFRRHSCMTSCSLLNDVSWILRLPLLL